MGMHPSDRAIPGPMRLIVGTLPFVLTVSLVVLVNLPVSFTGHVMPAPCLALASVYYWSLARPDLMPPPAVLAAGFMEDLLSGGPPGLWACGFLAAYLLTDRQRETLAGLDGIGALLGFAGAMVIAAETAYLVLFFFYWQAAPIAPLLLATAVTVLFYPVIAIAMGWVMRRAVGPMRRQD
jgi:rod shape-determining protein MreD